MKLQPVLDVSFEAKVVKFLKSVDLHAAFSFEAFLRNFASLSDDPHSDLVQSIVVIISSPSNVITTASMKMIDSLIWQCSAEAILALVKADLIPQIITTLNPLSLSLSHCAHIHTYLIHLINASQNLTTPEKFKLLRIEDHDEQQAVHETVLQQVLVPSEKYIGHLCMNRYSIIDAEQWKYFLDLITQFIRKSPYYQPTMNFVLHMPVIFTIPSCLTFFEAERSIWYLLYFMVRNQQEWNKQSRNIRRSGTAIFRCLRMEGIEDGFEEKLQHDRNSHFGGDNVDEVIELNNLQGMNLPRRR
ncbi:hypothetical protein BLNAU_1147 [Blattamonas nauphoetae]|uniref:Uncharacterized protein n=1 Tax=Blattamonas nauphoetae TaxID=2049346 RepID=A0ABQ9YJY2_9EUKA|nr:hypothetical protein BLNAU_1147 [Blattamonas nauphoetae]